MTNRKSKLSKVKPERIQDRGEGMLFKAFPTEHRYAINWLVRYLLKNAWGYRNAVSVRNVEYLYTSEHPGKFLTTDKNNGSSNNLFDEIAERYLPLIRYKKAGVDRSYYYYMTKNRNEFIKAYEKRMRDVWAGKP
jgi:hypothetical protein